MLPAPCCSLSAHHARLLTQRQVAALRWKPERSQSLRREGHQKPCPEVHLGKHFTYHLGRCCHHLCSEKDKTHSVCKASEHLQDWHFYFSGFFFFSPPPLPSYPLHSAYRDHLQSAMLISNSLHSILKTKSEKGDQASSYARMHFISNFINTGIFLIVSDLF